MINLELNFTLLTQEIPPQNVKLLCFTSKQEWLLCTYKEEGTLNGWFTRDDGSTVTGFHIILWAELPKDLDYERDRVIHD